MRTIYFHFLSDQRNSLLLKPLGDELGRPECRTSSISSFMLRVHVTCVVLPPHSLLDVRETDSIVRKGQEIVKDERKQTWRDGEE